MTQSNPDLGTCPLNRNKLVSSFCEIIPSSLAALEPVLEKAMAAVKALPCAPGEIEQVELTLREALANSIVHGNHSDPGKYVMVACFCECETDGGLLIVVRDQGLGFDPAEVPDPTSAEAIYSGHGRGIFLMRQFMDEVRFRKGGSEVELRKQGKEGCRP